MEKVGLLSLRNAPIVLVICVATAIAAPAQTFTTLYGFCSLTNCADGAYPQTGLVQASDGNLYGTTGEGGANSSGTVFKITLDGTLTTLYSFCSLTNCWDGNQPPAAMIQASDGNLYGTTVNGGTNGVGTVFKITLEGTLTTLYSFCGTADCPDGSRPWGGLMEASDGNFYGTTSGGGANREGTIFKITPEGVLSTFYSFCSLANCTDGASPLTGLIQATDGNFYGTTIGGGASNCSATFCGTVFKITPEGTLTTLYRFCGLAHCADGTKPNGPLVQGTDGNFYGTTPQGGAHNQGTVFRVAPNGTLTTLYSFCSLARCSDGSAPSDGLIQGSDGNLYGTTVTGGNVGAANGYGTVFEISPGGTLTTLYKFCSLTNCADGSAPSGLIAATDGNFYGTTASGGNGGAPNGNGTVLRLAAVPAVTLSTASLSFGNQALNETSTARTVTLRNSGSALVNISGVAIDGTGFAISANTCAGATLGLGKFCKVSVTFTPTILAKVTGTLTFTDNTSNSPQKVALSGAGIEPATLTPAKTTYAAQVVGTTSAAKTFTLTNSQNLVLTGIAVTTSGDFAVSATTCSSSLGAKGKCTISVTFTPTAIGTRTGQLSVSDSASNSPQASTLTGTGK